MADTHYKRRRSTMVKRYLPLTVGIRVYRTRIAVDCTSIVAGNQ